MKAWKIYFLICLDRTDEIERKQNNMNVIWKIDWKGQENLFLKLCNIKALLIDETKSMLKVIEVYFIIKIYLLYNLYL